MKRVQVSDTTPDWLIPRNSAERRLDSRYLARVVSAQRRGIAWTRRFARFVPASARVLLGENTDVLIKDDGTKIEIRPALKRPAPEEIFCPPDPTAVTIGLPPHWRFLDPAARQTRVLIHGASRAIFHENSFIAPGVFLTVNNRATFEIGPSSYVGHDCNVNCRAGISIGEGTLIGQQSCLMDYDGHPIFPAGTHPTGTTYAGASSPIRIGRHVWIGFRSIILKGAVIGDGAIIGAGSVVTGIIPPLSAAAGNPARVVKRGVTWRRF